MVLMQGVYTDCSSQTLNLPYTVYCSGYLYTIYKKLVLCLSACVNYVSAQHCLFVWLVEPSHHPFTLAVWKFSFIGNGALSVMTAGVPMMPGLCADNLDTAGVQHMEGLFTVKALDQYGLMIWHAADMKAHS